MEEKNTTMGTTETMEDYKEALEASYRRIRPGDIVTGTVIDVNDQDVTIDFNYYAPGRIPVTELSDDPTYHVLENVAVGDTLTATVVKTDDGAGNMLLSCKDAAEELAWDKLQEFEKAGNVREKVHCIITDIEMPLMDGHRLTKLVKTNDNMKKIPLIIFSSLVNEEMRIKGEQLGADAQLTKPEIGSLVSAIDDLIDKSMD